MKLKFLTLLPALILMVMIFFFSSKPAVDSNQSSLRIADQVFAAVENFTNNHYEYDQKLVILGFINHIVRKTAHFCEYALLSIAFAFHLFMIGRRRKGLFLLPILLSFLYAATDEFHQTFIPGRAGMIRDVLLDTSGAATGSLFFFLLIIIILKFNKKEKITVN